MRFGALVLLISLAACRPPALTPTPADSAFESGKRARFWSGSKGWVDGFLVHRLPAEGVQCLAVYVPDLSGAVMLAEIDSLRVDRHPGVGSQSTLPPPRLDTLPAPAWQTVSVTEMRLREPNICSSFVRRSAGPAA